MVCLTICRSCQNNNPFKVGFIDKTSTLVIDLIEKSSCILSLFFTVGFVIVRALIIGKSIHIVLSIATSILQIFRDTSIFFTGGFFIVRALIIGNSILIVLSIATSILQIFRDTSNVRWVLRQWKFFWYSQKINFFIDCFINKGKVEQQAIGVHTQKERSREKRIFQVICHDSSRRIQHQLDTQRKCIKIFFFLFLHWHSSRVLFQRFPNLPLVIENEQFNISAKRTADKKHPPCRNKGYIEIMCVVSFTWKEGRKTFEINPRLGIVQIRNDILFFVLHLFKANKIQLSFRPINITDKITIR